MKINQYLSGLASRCEPSERLVAETVQLLSGSGLDKDNRGSASQKVKDSLAPILQRQGWNQRFPINSDVSYDDYASFFLDFFMDLPPENCSHEHRFLFQFMFDNRQAIGTNLLKFELAAKNSNRNGRLTTSIGLCVEKSKIRMLGWDGSAASAQEYVSALTGPYGGAFSYPPLILAIEEF